MAGEVLPNDPHASNSVVVNSEEEEAAARESGYRKPWEHLQKFGGNGCSTAGQVPPILTNNPEQRPGPPAPDDELEALRAQAIALGLKPHHRAGVEKIRDMIAGVA